MNGVIDVGGGSRGIYGAGVFDRCLADGVSFDCCIGVSAGSANLVSFLAGQKGRNYLFYTEYAARRDYMSLHNLLRCGAYIDLDYVYGVLSNADGENPLDYPAIASYPGKILIPATRADGQLYYFSEAELAQDDYHALMASSALPYVCRPFRMQGYEYFDGGIADPVPLQKALSVGCGRVVLILTRPVNAPVHDEIDKACAAILQTKYPLLAKALRHKAERYRQSLALAQRLEREGRCRIIAPDDCCGVDTLTKNKDKLHALYEKGYADGAAIRSFLSDVPERKVVSG